MRNKLLFGTLCIVLASCLEESHWNAGPEETIRIGLEEFHTIRVNGIFDIILVQDTLNYSLVTCGKNIIDNVKINQDNGFLHLSQNIGMNWTRTYRHTILELHFTMLSSVQINSSIKIESKSTIESPALSIQENGSLSELNLKVNCKNFILSVPEENYGIYEVSGVAENSSLIQNGSAHFRTGNLVTDSCNIIHYGNGDCHINAKRIITGRILRNGSVFYKSYPNLKVLIENKNGRIIEEK